MATPERRHCLYTTRLTQKQKRWQDGRIAINRATGYVVLSKESGETLHATHLPAAEAGGWAEDDEVTIEAKYLVQIGGLLGADQQPGGGTSLPAGAVSSSSLTIGDPPSSSSSSAAGSSSGAGATAALFSARCFLKGPPQPPAGTAKRFVPPVARHPPARPPWSEGQENHQQQQPQPGPSSAAAGGPGALSARPSLLPARIRGKFSSKAGAAAAASSSSSSSSWDGWGAEGSDDGGGGGGGGGAWGAAPASGGRGGASDGSAANGLRARSQQQQRPPPPPSSSASRPSTMQPPPPLPGSRGAGRGAQARQFQASTSRLEFSTPATRAGLPPLRHVLLPDRFPSPGAYARLMGQALTEEINLLLCETAARQAQALTRHRMPSSAGGGGGGGGGGINSNLMTAMRRTGVYFYDEVELILSRKRKQPDGDDGFNRQQQQHPLTSRHFLKLRHMPPSPAGEDYQRGDLWVLSSTQDFTGAQYFLQALWHSPSQDGMLEVEFMDGIAPPAPSNNNPQYGGGSDGWSSSSSSSSRHFGEWQGRGGGSKYRGRGYGGDRGGGGGSGDGPTVTYYAIKLGNFQQLLQARTLLQQRPEGRALQECLPLLPYILDPTVLPPPPPPAPSQPPSPPPPQGAQEDEEEDEEDGWGDLPSFDLPPQQPAPPALVQQQPPPPPVAPPVLPLLSPSQALARQALEQAADDVMRVVGGLNEDQARVLRGVLDWFDPSLSPSAAPPLLLVHGVFGSGKSHLLAAICLLVDRIAELAGATSTASGDGGVDVPPPRVLVASATNVAVDRILVQLHEWGFQDMVRVGSGRRIDQRLTPYLFQANDGPGQQQQQQHPQSPTRHTIKHHRQMRRLHEARVVGVTCASCPTLQAALATAAGGAGGFGFGAGNSSLPIVIIDEASQLLEPLSLLPLLAAGGCRRAVLCGDPQQLPPPVAHARLAAASTGSSDASLQRPLFVRLADASCGASGGLQPIMLRTQYRVHPAISQLSSRLFYGGRLRDGVSAQDRCAVVGRLPPLTWLDVPHGTEQQQAGGDSFCNHTEAQAVVQALKWLLKARPAHDHAEEYEDEEDQEGEGDGWGKDDGASGGQQQQRGQRRRAALSPEEIGVIVPYRAQASVILRMMKEDGLAHESKTLKVSTVDAFQGAEREVILYSCVRTTGLGFLDSPQRLNVAITRARRHLVMVGNGEALAMLSEGAGGPAMWATIVRQATSCSHPQEFAELLCGDQRWGAARAAPAPPAGGLGFDDGDGDGAN